jgi:hypothetical protein
MVSMDIGTYLDEKIRHLDLMPIRKLDHREVLPRSILFYMWLAVFRPGTGDTSQFQYARRSQVIHWIGQQSAPDVDEIVEDGDLSVWVKRIARDGEDVYRISTDDLAKLSAVLDQHYNVTAPSELYNDTTFTYVKRINRSNNTAIIETVSETLKRMLNSVSANVEVIRIDNNLLMLRGLAQNWRFLIAVQPQDGAVSREQIGQYCANILDRRSEISGDLGLEEDMKVLILAPDTQDISAYRMVTHFPYMYHLWAWGFARFLYFFEQDYPTPDDKARIAQDFIALFPDERESPISELGMRRRLLEKKSHWSS